MKKRQPRPIEGVVQRQRREIVGDFEKTQPLGQASTFDPSVNKSTSFEQRNTSTNTGINMNLDNDNPAIDNSSIATENSSKWRSKRSKRRMKKQQKKDGRSKLNNRLRKVGMFSGIAVILVVGFLAFKGWSALQRIIVDRYGDGSPALNAAAELRGEGDGRINIMALGIGGDGHPGGTLADSIIITSIDPFSKEVALLSVPRDMYVDIPGYWSAKINEAHAIGEDQGHPGGGPALMRETIEQTLDIPIHYFMRVDFTAYVQAIDTLGGIDVNVTNPVVNDYTYAWDIGYPLNIPEGQNHLDGQTALLYVRSRYTSSGGDFDRGERQRDLLIALKDKVLSVGTFGDPTKIAELADNAGDHVRTDLQLSEIIRLYDMASEIPQENIVTYGLTSAGDNYLTGSNIGGASVLLPRAGDYSEIQRFVREIFVDGFIRSEGAEIEIYDASTNGAGTFRDDELRSYGYNITKFEDHSDTQFDTVIYDLKGGDAPFTKRYLEQRFGVTMVSGNELPASIGETEAAFVIVIGDNAQQN